MYGSGYYAGCRLDSIGCASGSCRAAAPWVEESPPKPAEPAPEPESGGDVWYRVQVGAFREKANADRLCAELQGKGYAAFVKAGA